MQKGRSWPGKWYDHNITAPTGKPKTHQRLGSTVSTNLKSDQVAVQIEHLILAGTLVAGERLPTEIALVEQFGVSRSVVRDAMRTLAARGLIEIRQGHGTIVTAPNDSAFGHALALLITRSNATVGDVLDAREIVETALAPLMATRGRESDWARARERYDTFAQAVNEERWDDAFAAHLAFHMTLLESLHSPVLELMLKPMHELILGSSVPARQTAKEDWQVEMHAPILEALRAGDADAAIAAMRRHFASTKGGPFDEMRRQHFVTQTSRP